jgi:hypothetical protein
VGVVGLHPVWIIFAMFAFGYLFGFVGLLVRCRCGDAVLFASGSALSREPALLGRATDLTATANRAELRQLALALDHTESFAREAFSGHRTKWRWRSSTPGPTGQAALSYLRRKAGQEPPRCTSRRQVWSPRAHSTKPAALVTGAVVIDDLARRLR